MLIQITDPQGTCVEVGGFDVDLCTEIDDFPAEWDVAASGDYSYTVDFCGTALTGDGTWTFVFVHGWGTGTQDQWAGSLTLEVVGEGGFSDCNGNGIEDVEDIANGTSEDCNDNGRPDECDLGPSTDCDGNGVIDACETLPDCDSNGVSDCAEIAGGATDCNADGIPDSCESAGGGENIELSFDTGVLDGNGTTSVYEVEFDGVFAALGSILASFFIVFFIDSIGPFPIGFSAPFGLIFGSSFPSKIVQNTMCFPTLFWDCFFVPFRSLQTFILELSPTRGCIFHIFTFPEKSSKMS